VPHGTPVRPVCWRVLDADGETHGEAYRGRESPIDGRLELWDASTAGLCLRVSETKKVWICRYRTDDGRQRRMTLGEYTGAHGLKWARGEVEDLRVRVGKGEDPAGARQSQKALARSEPIKTFNDLIDAYLIACECGHYQPRRKQKRAVTLSGERKVLARNIRPALGAMRVEDITRSHIRKVLNDMLDRRIAAQTNKTHALIRQVFNYGIFLERCEVIREALLLSDGRTDGPGDPVFPSPRGKDRPINEGALSHLMRLLVAALGLRQLSPHDLRRTGATAMASERLGVMPIVEPSLSH
jgi:hypothetical protein